MSFQFSDILKNPKVQLTAASTSMFAVGVTLGYFTAERLLKSRYEKIAEKEREDARAYYARQFKSGEFSDPVTLASGYNEMVEGNDDDSSPLTAILDRDTALLKEQRAIIDTMHYRTVSDDDDSEEEDQDLKEQVDVRESISKNIFDNRTPSDDDDFDLESEKATRDEDHPYILSHDEYYQGDLDYSQNTLTYFVGDQVLVDEEDNPISNVRNTVGEENLLRFGYGSKDENVVYIRNHRLEVDFEVVRSFGKYTEEVLGFIEHAEKPKLRKFRNYD